MQAVFARRVLTPALYLNALLLMILAVVLFFLRAVPLSQAEPVLATRVGDLFVAFGLCLLVVARGYQQDRRWLLIPIFVLTAELLNAAIQFTIQLLNLKIPTDPMVVPPLVFSGVFLLIYLIGYGGVERNS